MIPQELNIGNWLNVISRGVSTYGRVISIKEMNDTRFMQGDSLPFSVQVRTMEKTAAGGTVEGVVEGNINYFEPIPLTVDILLKAGFETSRNEFYNLDNFTIVDCNGLFVNSPNNIPVRYVHDLQNLFFALRRTELKISSL